MRVIRHVRHLDDLERLSPEWTDLLGRAPLASVFQSPGWCIPWWRAFGEGALHVLVDEEDDGLHAVAPLFVRPATVDEPPTLALIGTGNSDCLDILADSPDAAARLFGAALADAGRGGWSIDLRRVPPHSILLTRPEIGCVLPDVPCPALSLAGDANRFEHLLDAAFRKKLRSSRRALDRLGTVTFDTVRGHEVQRGLDDLFRLHADRWALKALRGVLAGSQVQGFHRCVAARLDSAGWLRLVRMRIGEEVAAMYYGFQWSGVAWFYLGGFNPHFAAFSPGSQMLREVLRMCIEEGVSVFDFLSGQEHYKYRWGAVDRPFFTRRIEHQAPAASA
jgi:CelD/BcsL family acetyltransferase involved in cellulose biosynthesis